MKVICAPSNDAKTMPYPHILLGMYSIPLNTDLSLESFMACTGLEISQNMQNNAVKAKSVVNSLPSFCKKLQLTPSLEKFGPGSQAESPPSRIFGMKLIGS